MSDLTRIEWRWGVVKEFVKFSSNCCSIITIEKAVWRMIRWMLVPSITPLLIKSENAQCSAWLLVLWFALHDASTCKNQTCIVRSIWFAKNFSSLLYLIIYLHNGISLFLFLCSVLQPELQQRHLKVSLLVVFPLWHHRCVTGQLLHIQAVPHTLLQQQVTLAEMIWDQRSLTELYIAVFCCPGLDIGNSPIAQRRLCHVLSFL